MDVAGWLLPQDAKLYHFFKDGSPHSLCLLWDRVDTKAAPFFESELRPPQLCKRCSDLRVNPVKAVASSRSMQFNKIVESVCAYYQIKLDELISPSHYAELVQARYVVIYLARKHTHLSLPTLGRALGKRHPTTILYGQRKIEAQLKFKERLKIDVACLEERIGA